MPWDVWCGQVCRGAFTERDSTEIRMRGCRTLAKVLWCAVGCMCVVADAHQAGTSRPAHSRGLMVSDLFRLQELGPAFGGPYAFAQHGESLAITVLRATDSDPRQHWKELTGDNDLLSNARGDVWVESGIGQTLRNVTEGAADGSGWFSPQWSPDGVHLGILSTRGGELRLWTWNRLTGQLKLLSKDEVTFSLRQRNVAHDQPYVWVDSRRILCTVLAQRPT